MLLDSENLLQHCEADSSVLSVVMLISWELAKESQRAVRLKYLNDLIRFGLKDGKGSHASLVIEFLKDPLDTVKCAAMDAMSCCVMK